MDIGDKIRNTRLKLGLTQEVSAERSDLTKGFISQLERDTTSPSVDTLESIVTALGTNLSEFFKDTLKPPVVHPLEDAVMLSDEELGHRQYFLIAGAQQLAMEPVLLELDRKGRSRSYPPYEGELFGFVLSGHLSLHLGEEEHVLETEDSFYFEADDEFYVENKGKGQARLVWVMSPPNF